MTKWKWIFACVFICSLVLFFAPIPAGPGGSWGLDKIVHLGIFAALLFSGFIAFRNSRAPLLFALLLYGPLVEVLQRYVFTYRSFDYRDMLFDFSGLAAGYLIYRAGKSQL
ncbi:MAG: VanZ family protein [Patescibacteria group bacterium]|nr:VanZ family protein [Patescibacteria group bacterium]